MAFFKFRNRGPQANEGRNTPLTAAPAESVEAMRRRARHRLLGAAVLVLVGVIGFPLLFDTQPRPVSVDIPIEIPDRNKVKPLTLPAQPGVSSATPAAVAPPAGATAPLPASATAPLPPPASQANMTTGGGMITEAADGSELPPPKQASKLPQGTPAPKVAQVTPAPAAKPAPAKPENKAEAKPEARTEAKPASKSPDDAARARALLEGKPTTVAATAAKPAPAAPASAASSASADDAGRFVVQVGAFADADKAREVRQKLDRAGLKSFSQVAKTADGERTRVRVGPFGSRAEADKAAGRIKGLALSASVLSL